MTNHKIEASKHAEALEGHFKQASALELKPMYDQYMKILSLVEDDIKEANRRKPKKAKATKSVKDEASS